MYSGIKATSVMETTEMEKAIDKLIEEKIQHQRRCATIRVQVHRLKKAIASINKLTLPFEES